LHPELAQAMKHYQKERKVLDSKDKLQTHRRALEEQLLRAFCMNRRSRHFQDLGVEPASPRLPHLENAAQGNA
jgi:hypothetical protein